MKFHNQEWEAYLRRRLIRLYIRARRTTTWLFLGAYRSRFRGQGIAFSGVREYIVGDDVRWIDWNVTARMNKPFVKEFEEERERAIVFVVDNSQSLLFSSGSHPLKWMVLTEICAILAYSALTSGDRIALLTGSDPIITTGTTPEQQAPHPQPVSFLPFFRTLRKFPVFLHRLLEFIVEDSPLNALLAFIEERIRHPTLVFVLSDFLHTPSEEVWRRLAIRHELVSIAVRDPIELGKAKNTLRRLASLPTVSIAAHKQNHFRFGHSGITIHHIAPVLTQFQDFIRQCRRLGIDLLTVRTDRSYLPALMQFFARRGRKG